MNEEPMQSDADVALEVLASEKHFTIFLPLQLLENAFPYGFDPLMWRLHLVNAGIPALYGYNLKNMREKGMIDWWEDGLVVGKVLSIYNFADTTDLFLVRVAYTNTEKTSILTSTASLAHYRHHKEQGIELPDLRVPVALIGSRVIKAGSRERPRPLVRMRQQKFQGHESEGDMVCSSCELGMDDYHDDIFLFLSDVIPGTSIRDYLGDYAICLVVPLGDITYLHFENIYEMLSAYFQSKVDF